MTSTKKKQINKRRNIITSIILCGTLFLQASAVAIMSLPNIFRSADAVETRTLIVDGSQLTSTATTEVTEKTYDDLTFVFSAGAKTQSSSGNNKFSSSAIFIGKSGTYVYNKSPIPGKITKFELYANKGASAKVSVGINFSNTAITAFDAKATNTYAATLESLDNIYDCSSKLSDNCQYFWYQVTNANNSQVEFRITYEPTQYAYTLNFNGNGGDGEQKSLGNNTGVFTLPECKFKAPSHDKEFAGWGTGTTLDTKISGTTYTIQSGKEATLYALWKDKTYVDIPVGTYTVLFDSYAVIEVPNGAYNIKEESGSTHYKPLLAESTDASYDSSYKQFIYQKNLGVLSMLTESNAVISSVEFEFYTSLTGILKAGGKEITPSEGATHLPTPRKNGVQYTYQINGDSFEFDAIHETYDAKIFRIAVVLVVADPQSVIDKINAIGEVTYTQESYEKIVAARNAYDALSSKDKLKVTNLVVLEAAEIAFNTLMGAKVLAVETLIALIGTVDYTSGEKITAARNAYDALLDGDAGKNYISNYSTLTAAEKEYELCYTAHEVETLIADLPDPEVIRSYNYHGQISTARSAYNALKEGAKTKVSNINILEACEAAEAPYAPEAIIIVCPVLEESSNMTGENDATLFGLDETKWSIVGSKGGTNYFPGLNKEGTIRLYASSKEEKCSIIISSLEENSNIRFITINFASNTPSKELIVKAGEETLTPAYLSTYIVNGDEVIIGNNDQNSDQIYISSIVVAYEIGVASSLTYHGVDGIDNTNNPTYYIEGKGADLTSPIGLRYGYTFGGWYDNESFSGNPIESIPTTQTGDVELYGKWNANKHQVTFYEEDGETVYESYEAEYESKLDLPVEPTKAKHTFKGWSDALGGEVVWSDGQYDMPNENLEFYPVFEIDPIQDVIISGTFSSIESTDVNKLLKATVVVAEGKQVSTTDVLWTISNSEAGSFAKSRTANGECPVFTALKPCENVTIRATSAEDQNKFVEFTFNVVIPSDEYLASIKIIKGEDAKTTYLDTDEEVDTTDLTVDGTYLSARLPNYQSVRDVTDAVTWTLNVQNKSVVAEDEGAADSFDIEVIRTVEHIDVIQNPSKVEYFEQEDFRPDGLIIKVYYHIGDVETVTYGEDTKDLFSFDIVTFRSYLTEKVTLTYEEGTAEIPVSVYKNEAVDVSFYRGPAKNTYFEGECFDPSYITYRVEFTNGAIRYIKYADDTEMYFVYDDEPLTLGTDIMHMVFAIDEIVCENDFPITVNQILPVKIEVEPYKVVLNYNTDMTTADITAYVHKNNGTRETIDFDDLLIEGYDKTVPGRYDVTVTYLTFTTKILVVVDQSYEVDYIEAKSLVNEFAYNEEFNSELVYVDIIYTDGHRLRNVIPDEVSGYDKTKVGEQTLTVKLDDKETTIKVTVKESTVIDHIEATTAKTTLAYGEELTLNDFDVTIYYTDGRKVEHQAPTYIFGYNKTVVGKQNVKVRVNNSFTYVEVKVNESTEIDHIEAVSLKPNVSYGYEFSVNDVSLTVVYKDGRRVDYQKPDSFSGYDKTKIGKQTLTVKYQEKETTIEVNVKESKEVTNVVATCAKAELAKGEALSKDDVTFTLTYADGRTESAKATYLAGYDANKVGEQKVTVAYKGLVKIIIIIVADK